MAESDTADVDICIVSMLALSLSYETAGNDKASVKICVVSLPAFLTIKDPYPPLQMEMVI